MNEYPANAAVLVATAVVRHTSELEISQKNKTVRPLMKWKEGFETLLNACKTGDVEFLARPCDRYGKSIPRSSSHPVPVEGLDELGLFLTENGIHLGALEDVGAGYGTGLKFSSKDLQRILPGRQVGTTSYSASNVVMLNSNSPTVQRFEPAARDKDTSALPKYRRGAQPSYDWEAAKSFCEAYIQGNGRPEKQTVLEDALGQWFVDQTGDQPDVTTMRRHFKTWRKSLK